MASKSDIQRGLSVQFKETGAKKLQTEVGKVDKSLKKVGKDGSKSLGSLNQAAKGTVGSISDVGKSMGDALDPIDKAFAGTDKLFSIFGKLSAVGAVLGVGLTLLSGVFDKLATDSAGLVNEQVRLRSSFDDTATAAKLMGEAFADISKETGLAIDQIDALAAAQLAIEKQTQSLANEAIQSWTAELVKNRVAQEQLSESIEDGTVLQGFSDDAMAGAEAQANKLRAAKASLNDLRKKEADLLDKVTKEQDRYARAGKNVVSELDKVKRGVSNLSYEWNQLRLRMEGVSGVDVSSIVDVMTFGITAGYRAAAKRRKKGETKEDHAKRARALETIRARERLNNAIADLQNKTDTNAYTQQVNAMIRRHALQKKDVKEKEDITRLAFYQSIEMDNLLNDILAKRFRLKFRNISKDEAIIAKVRADADERARIDFELRMKERIRREEETAKEALGIKAGEFIDREELDAKLERAQKRINKNLKVLRDDELQGYRDLNHFKEAEQRIAEMNFTEAGKRELVQLQLLTDARANLRYGETGRDKQRTKFEEDEADKRQKLRDKEREHERAAAQSSSVAWQHTMRNIADTSTGIVTGLEDSWMGIYFTLDEGTKTIQENFAKRIDFLKFGEAKERIKELQEELREIDEGIAKLLGVGEHDDTHRERLRQKAIADYEFTRELREEELAERTEFAATEQQLIDARLAQEQALFDRRAELAKKTEQITFDTNQKIAESIHQVAAARVIEGIMAEESAERVVNAIAAQVAQQAALEALLYGAKALAAWGTALFTGSPAAYAAAKSFTAAAAGFGALAVTAGAVASATGGLRSGLGYEGSGDDSGAADTDTSAPRVPSSRDEDRTSQSTIVVNMDGAMIVGRSDEAEDTIYDLWLRATNRSDSQ